MGLQHLDVPVARVEPQGRVFDQADQYVHAQREVAAHDDGDLLGGGLDLGLLLGRQPGGADHQGRTARLGAGLGQSHRGLGRREVDDDVAQLQIDGLAAIETGGDHHVLAGVQNLRHGAAHAAPGAGDAGVEDVAHAVSFGLSASPPRMSAQKRLALPAKLVLRGVWLSPSDAASSASSSFWRAFRSVGVSTNSSTTRSPRPRPFRCGMPLPLMRTVLPVWAPAGTSTGALHLPSQASEIRQGASTTPPRAATVIGTGTVTNRSRLSRSNSSWGCTDRKT